MKFAATLIATASAAANSADVVKTNCQTNSNLVACWESYFTLNFNNDTQSLEVNQDSKTGKCGFQYEDKNQPLANRTCTVTSSTPPSELMFGNGAFVTSGGDLTGFDGESGFVSAIVNWDTSFDENWVAANSVDGKLSVDNTTEFNHEDCFTTGLNRQIQISCVDNGAPLEDEPMFMMTNINIGNPSNFAIANYGGVSNTLAVSLGVECDTHAVTSHMGDITPGNDNDCSFVIAVTDDKPDLLYFSVQVLQQVDFFAATVV